MLIKMNIQAISIKEKNMAKVTINFKMEASMKDNFLKMKKMEMVYLNTIQEIFIKEIIKMVKKVDLEFTIFKKLKMFMKVNGKQIKEMEWEL